MASLSQVQNIYDRIQATTGYITTQPSCNYKCLQLRTAGRKSGHSGLICSEEGVFRSLRRFFKFFTVQGSNVLLSSVSEQTSGMASGVAISDEVIKHYDAIRVRLHGTDEQERFKLVVMCLSKDQKSIIVDDENCLRVKDVANMDVLKKVLSKLPTDECRYALYDCSYVNKESVKEDLVFILSAPDNAPLKSKMVYASSKAALKAKMPGLKFEWQINEPSDRELSCLVEKLGGNLKSLEGIPV